MHVRTVGATKLSGNQEGGEGWVGIRYGVVSHTALY